MGAGPRPPGKPPVETAPSEPAPLIPGGGPGGRVGVAGPGPRTSGSSEDDAQASDDAQADHDAQVHGDAEAHREGGDRSSGDQARDDEEAGGYDTEAGREARAQVGGDQARDKHQRSGDQARDKHQRSGDDARGKHQQARGSQVGCDDAQARREARDQARHDDADPEVTSDRCQARTRDLVTSIDSRTRCAG